MEEAFFASLWLYLKAQIIHTPSLRQLKHCLSETILYMLLHVFMYATVSVSQSVSHYSDKASLEVEMLSIKDGGQNKKLNYEMIEYTKKTQKN